MSMAYAFFPAQMLTVLPLGWVFYLHGTLSAETFITVIILALGMSAPIVAAFNFVDTLAQVGTTVGQVDEILKAEEQSHSSEPVVFNGHSIDVKDVSFGYHEDKEILHGIRSATNLGPFIGCRNSAGLPKSSSTPFSTISQ